ncbi:hypothetical protein [Pendulispora rubella]|uniref:hypothetical protein n=1 Tax=Pendulispora rubella TaxID=2741070 RepID=UPI0030E22A3B
MHEENGSPPCPSIGIHDDSESTTLQELIVRAEQRERRRQDEILRAQAANERRAADEREWEWRRQRAEAARLERTRASPTPPTYVTEIENDTYTKALAALMGAVFALVLLGSSYYWLVSPARVGRWTEASHRMLEERSAALTQMERAMANERTKSAALSIELAKVHANNAQLERQLSAVRRERHEPPARMPNAPTMAVVTAPRRALIAPAAPADEQEKPPPPRPAEEAPCHPGDPLCSNL